MIVGEVVGAEGEDKREEKGGQDGIPPEAKEEEGIPEDEATKDLAVKL